MYMYMYSCIVVVYILCLCPLCAHRVPSLSESTLSSSSTIHSIYTRREKKNKKDETIMSEKENTHTCTCTITCNITNL